MNSNDQWNQNKYEPGLFTLYLQDQSLCPPLRNYEEMPKRNNFNKRKYQSQVKFTQKESSNCRYIDFNNTITPQNCKKIFNQAKCIHSLTKMKEKQINIERFSTEYTQNHTSDDENNYHKAQTIKNINMNKYFHYDINRARSKLFVYQGQPSPFVKKLSKNLHKNPLKNKSHAQNSLYNKWRINNESSITDNIKQSINSDNNIILKAKKKINFLQFLTERNKNHRIIKADTSKMRIQKTLEKLRQFNYPQMLQNPLRIATSR